ncbi:MAG: L,D-transpeptidase family protein [Gammaproteobacteria bacterium]
MTSNRNHLLWVFGLLTALAAGPAGAQDRSQASIELQERVEQYLFTGELCCGGEDIASRELLPEIYVSRDFLPMWSAARLDELLAIIAAAPADGLNSEDYHYAALQEMLALQRADPIPRRRADLDILATDALIRFGYHQRFGKVNPVDLDPNVNFRREAWPDGNPGAAVINAAVSATPLAEIVAGFFPRPDYYEDLRSHLAEYRLIAEAGGWPAVTPGPALRQGDTDVRVAEIRRRLAVTNDLAPDTPLLSPEFDEAVAAGVSRFQARHRLEPDGIAGANSFEAMNVPVQARIDQLRMSLERLRWIDQELTDDFVAVNIADFRAFLVRKGEITWFARAQVGKPYRMTPIFRGDISYLEMNPTWTIPPGILRNDVLPRIKQDPNYLLERNISVIDRDGAKVDPLTVDWSVYSKGVPYTLRQEPGPNNALGRIKFIFPNEHFVFLHDTPSRGLFDRAERAFSSGCIRVDKPLELAELLLGDPDKWSMEKLQAVLDSRKTQRVNLRPKEPVLILYLTASLDLDGSIRFAKDIYSRDDDLLAALNGPVKLEAPAVAAQQ